MARHIGRPGKARALSQNPRRPLLMVVATAVALLIVVSVFTGWYYYTTSSDLSAKDQEIGLLRSTIAKENVTVLTLQTSILALNASISLLNLELATLKANETVYAAALHDELLRLQNQSAMVGLELAVVEEVGNLAVTTYHSNSTAVVPPGSTLEVASKAAASNGTLVFLSPAGCPSTGDTVQSTGTQYSLTIVLDPGGPPLKSDFRTVSGTPFAVDLENTGATSVGCTYSLLYVQGP